MKRLFLVLSLSFSASLPAQAPVAVPLSQEPHHHLVLENDYVRVFRVSVPAHAATLLHQHDVPYLYISLGPADVVNAVQGRPEARILMADGQVGYSPGHFAHIARTDAGSTFDNVTIELLRPQGEPKNLCDKIVDGPIKDCSLPRTWPADSPLRNLAKGGMIPRRAFETAEIEVASYSPSFAGTYNRDSNKSQLVVAESGPPMHVQVAGEPDRFVKSGEMLWIDAGTDWKIVLPSGDTPTRFHVIRFKDTGAAANP
jgi:hypothetical protein